MSDINTGLSNQTLHVIKQTLAKFPCIASAILYGSRAKGTFRQGADIDLTLHTKGEMPNNFLVHVSNALDDLDIPYSVDLSLYAHINNPQLLEHIQRVGIELFNAEKFQALQQEITQLNQQDASAFDNKSAKTSSGKAGYQSEEKLEASFIKHLQALGYQFVHINNSEQLLVNLKQ